MAYIEFQNLCKSYGSKQVLDDINLSIGKGELVTLLGPSGCGKSTLLRCLAGLEEVTEGRILLDGTDITGIDPRKRDIGMVFQQYSLFPNMTVTRNVAFGLKIKKMDKALIREKTADILKIVGLDEQAGMYPAQLSGGQQQRAALARGRRCFCSTSRCPRSTRCSATAFRSRSDGSRKRSASPPSSSRTTRTKRW